ncbi:unnamed protein product [Citrullus colocynthis]|uniref:Uncharacterized protein n=1 Tax=Citrullus colocynthis TaxID=252529 RepID=A0ABP0YLW4_9ROSI
MGVKRKYAKTVKKDRESVWVILIIWGFWSENGRERNGNGGVTTGTGAQCLPVVTLLHAILRSDALSHPHSILQPLSNGPGPILFLALIGPNWEEAALLGH